MTSFIGAGRSIVVGVDGSPPALAAVRHAAVRAARRRSRLRIVHAYEFPGHMPTRGVEDESPLAPMRRHGRAWLAEAREIALDIDPELAVETEMAAMSPTVGLSRAAEDAAVLVLGNRGRGRLSGLLVGSTAFALAGRAPCPVILVRAEPEARTDVPIVVGVDGTTVSEAALAFAFAEASTVGARLVAVHAWAESLFETLIAGEDVARNWDEHRVRAEETLAERLAGWQEKYPDVRVEREATHERPGRALRRYAETARLAVVGRHTRDAGRDFFVGSTSQYLLRHARCPVAVVRPETCDSEEFGHACP